MLKDEGKSNEVIVELGTMNSKEFCIKITLPWDCVCQKKSELF